LRADVPTIDAVRYVAGRMRAKDVEEFIALSFAADAAALADDLVKRYATHSDGVCFFDANEPVGVGAMVEARPNVRTLMFFATDSFPNIALPIARFTKRILFPKYREAGAHRIECISIDGYEEAHRWIDLVGMSHEGAMRGYGRNGETFHHFAWVADNVR